MTSKDMLMLPRIFQMTRNKKKTYVPVTPGGTVLMHLESNSEDQAKKRLMRDAAHMPYNGWKEFEERGYTIEEYQIDE